jgi:hypothetical protein
MLLTVLLLHVIPSWAQSTTQFDVQSLLREVEAKQKENSARAQRQSYMLKRTVQDLNDKSEVKKEKVYVYQVFPLRQGLPAMLLLIEDGKLLSAEKLAKEKVKINKYWQKHKNDAPKSTAGEEAPWFTALDYSFVGNEHYEGREVVVLSFKPKAAYAPKKDAQKFISGLKGQIWIEPAEKVMVKIHGELTHALSGGHFPGFLSSLRPGSVLTVDFMPIGDGLWGVKRVEFAYVQKYSGPLFLSQTAHTRQLDEISDYHPIDPETKDLFAKPPSA